MPMRRELYPKNWPEIARRTKQAANWHCQDCDRPCLLPHEDLLDFWLRLGWTIAEVTLALSDDRGRVRSGKAKRFEMSAAHLDHNPPNCSPDNLRALCSVCHCRMDLKAIALKRRLKRERDGQLNWLTMPVDDDPARVQLSIDGVL